MQPRSAFVTGKTAARFLRDHALELVL